MFIKCILYANAFKKNFFFFFSFLSETGLKHDMKDIACQQVLATTIRHWCLYSLVFFLFNMILHIILLEVCLLSSYTCTDILVFFFKKAQFS